MIRKTYGALVMIALAALVMVGCGKEDVTDLNNTWTEKDGELATKLNDVKAKRAELETQLMAVNVTNITDSVKLADRATAETMLKDQAAQIAEIETTMSDLRAKRDSAMTAGKRAEFEAAWKAAETEYAGAMEKLNTIEQQSSDVKNKIESLNNASTTPAGDTAAANGMNGMKDTTKANETATVKTDDAAKKTSETAKSEDTAKSAK